MLVIDDDSAVLGSCKAIFQDNGFEVETTTNPREGLELSTKNNYSVILCDWKMPGFNRLDVIAETVAQNVGVDKANSPWVSLFVLGVLAGAYIGFGGFFFSVCDL
jgi:DNA-binding NtrC family response regulator